MRRNCRRSALKRPILTMRSFSGCGRAIGARCACLLRRARSGASAWRGQRVWIMPRWRQ
nr:MAG TPA: hypothetical protein [Siphoviridae sp. ctJJg9]